MRIAVDAYEVRESATGAGRAIDNILVRLVPRLPGHHFHVFTRERVARYGYENLSQEVIPARGGYFSWQNGPFLRRLRRIKPDLILASNYTLPFYCPWPSLLMVHDISIIAHPEWYPKKVALGRRYLLRRSLKRARRVVVPSHFTEGEMRKHCRINPEKIKVIRLGVDDGLKRPRDSEIIGWKKSKGLENKKVIGFLGSIFRRRNIPTLVEAVRLLRGDFHGIGLYVVGDDLSHPPLRVSRILEKDWILWEKSLPEPELPIFYSSCDAFAFLSEYEGFGFPPLEALACGTVPVLLNRGSLGEVFRDTAVFVDKLDVRDILSALKCALSDEPAREAIRNNFERARHGFSWERAADEYALLVKENV